MRSDSSIKRLSPLQGLTGVVAVLVLLAFPLRSQGPLEPADNPQPTMKSIAQISPEVEVNAANTPGDDDSLFKITSAGSYYLSSNLTGETAKSGIEIAAHDVTLDLRGFTLVGVPESQHGIHSPAQQINLVIQNGTLRSWGRDGLRLRDPINCRLEALSASNNALGGLVMNEGKGAVVKRCVAAGNGASGLLAGVGASVTRCAAYSNGGTGIQTGAAGTIADSSASSNGSSGIVATDRCTVSNCAARLNGGHGILIGGSVRDSTAASNGGSGFVLADNTVVRGCSANSNTEHGILAGRSCMIRGSTASQNTEGGISAEFSGCSVVSCVAHDNKQDGIVIGFSGTVRNCVSRDNGEEPRQGSGILATGSGNRIESNHLVGNDYGISAILPGSRDNLIVRNSVSARLTDYRVDPATNTLGPVLSRDDLEGSSNPHANYSQ